MSRGYGFAEPGEVKPRFNHVCFVLVLSVSPHWSQPRHLNVLKPACGNGDKKLCSTCSTDCSQLGVVAPHFDTSLPFFFNRQVLADFSSTFTCFVPPSKWNLFNFYLNFEYIWSVLWLNEKLTHVVSLNSISACSLVSQVNCNLAQLTDAWYSR